MNASSCGLKHVAQYYMTLQCGVGRRISGFCKRLYFFLEHMKSKLHQTVHWLRHVLPCTCM